jgi:hypothetical protein
VVWLNKPTSTSGDDLEEIYYQKMEYKDNREKNHSKPKALIHQNLTLTQKGINNKKRRKFSFFPMPLAATKKRKIWITMLSVFSPYHNSRTLCLLPFISIEVGGQNTTPNWFSKRPVVG